MKFHRRPRVDVGIDLTPLIDVVFLLLIFFMVSTTFIKESRLQLNLPEADGQPAPDQAPPIEVVVQRDGTYAVNGNALVNRQVDTLVRALRDVAGQQERPQVAITADADAPHQAVVRAMDAAGRVGLSELSITTRTPAPGTGGPDAR